MLEAERVRQGRQSRFWQKRTKNVSAAAAGRIQGCFRLTAAPLRGVAAPRPRKSHPARPATSFLGIGEKCGLALAEANGQPFYFPRSNCRSISIYTRFSDASIQASHESDRITIRRLTLPARTGILLAGVHMPSKLYWSEHSQAIECTNLRRLIQKEEQRSGHSRTVLVGDFNMNPFENGVAGAAGLHAVMTKQIASKKRRTVLGEQYPFFYNPMWSCFADRTAGPPGTHYYERAEHVCCFWNVFDQVLLRPDLMDRFPSEELRILTEDGDSSLLSPSGLPDKAAGSDHLPVLFKLDL